MITGFYQNGIVITDRAEIIIHYLKKGLILDILSYSPIIAQSVLKKSYIGGIMMKFFQLLIFCKIKRVQIIMTNFQEIISLNGKHNYILNILNLLYQIIFFNHLIACVWYGLAYHNSFDQITWLDLQGMRHQSPFTRYMSSLYWAVSVMVTISNTHTVPQNDTELIVGVVIFLVSSIFYGFTLHTMRDIFDQLSKNEKNYKYSKIKIFFQRELIIFFRENLAIINDFMRKNGINFELQGRVRKYLEHLMTKESNAEKEQEILNKLTLSLKREVVINSSGKLLSQIPFFASNFSEQTIEELSFRLKKIRYSPEEYLYRLNDLDEGSIYIISNGSLESVINSQNGSKQIQIYQKGEIIGLYSFFTDEPRSHSMRSRNFSTVFEIKKPDFLSILKKHDVDYEKFVMIRDKLKLYNNQKDLKIRCQCCNKETHLAFKCPIINYIPDFDFLIKRLNFSKEQERQPFSIGRKNHRFNALFNREYILNRIISKYTSEDEDSFSSEEEESKMPRLQQENSKSLNDNDNEKNVNPSKKSDSESKEEIKHIPSINNMVSETKIKRFPTKNNMLFPESISEMEEKSVNDFTDNKEERLPSEELVKMPPFKNEINLNLSPPTSPKMMRNFREEEEYQMKGTKERNQMNRHLKKPQNSKICKDKYLLDQETPKTPNSQLSYKSISQGLIQKTKTNQFLTFPKLTEKEKEKVETLFYYDFEKAHRYQTYFKNGNSENVISKANRTEFHSELSSPLQKRKSSRGSRIKNTKTRKFSVFSLERQTKIMRSLRSNQIQ